MTQPGPLAPYLDSLTEAACKGFAESSKSTDSCRRDMRRQVEALDQALAAEQPDQFAEMVSWLSVYLAAIGVDPADCVRGLRRLEEASAELPDEQLRRAAQEALERAQSRLAEPEGLSSCLKIAPRTEAAQTEDAAAYVRNRRDRLAGLTVAMHYMRRPGDAVQHRDLQWRCLEDAGFHLDHLAESLAADDTALFTAYVDWCRTVLARLDLEDQLEDHLRALRDVLTVEAPPALAETLARHVESPLSSAATGEIPSFLADDAPHGALARAYLDALLARDRRKACRMVVEAAEDGVPVGEIYQDVFQPAQHEVGRLWQLGRISVAQEHYCTAATQMAMSQLYPRIFSERRRNRTVVATCVGGNLHEIGVRFVADMFELDGWDSIYLGADTPGGHLIREVVERDADLVAVSATLSTHLEGVRKLIAELRADPRTANVKVVVGGYPFTVVPTLWKTVGADATASSAAEAVAVAAGLMGDAP